MKKILIAEDNPVNMELMREILGTSCYEIIEAENGQQALAKIEEFSPSLVLLDINMAPMSGFDVLKMIRKYSPGSKIIGVSMHSQPAYAKKMLQVGARGYVTKNSSREEMFKAIMEVFRGNKYVCDEIKTIISEQLLDEKRVAFCSLDDADSPELRAGCGWPASSVW